MNEANEKNLQQTVPGSIVIPKPGQTGENQHFNELPCNSRDWVDFLSYS
jgi:hypothetical protein